MASWPLARLGVLQNSGSHTRPSQSPSYSLRDFILIKISFLQQYITFLQVRPVFSKSWPTAYTYRS